MEEDPTRFLAREILTEDQVITYRLLSRSFNLHVNEAKEILYEFYELQNAKKPRSLYATYLVYGTKKQAVKVEEQDGDVEMTNSQNEEVKDVPFSDEVPTYSLSVVNEGQLQELLAEYDKVTSIHIYSLAPHPLEDLQLLGDIGRHVMGMSTEGKVPAVSKEFGSVTSLDVHRRERHGQSSSPAPSMPTPKAEPTSHSQQDAKPAVMNEEPKAASQPNVKVPASSAPTTKKPAATAPLKRQGSSGGIGQMFARAAANPKKPAAKPTGSGSTPVAASAAEEDQKMAMSDDGEDDVEPRQEAEQESSSAGQSRKNRQTELRRMMEESDEDEPEKADSPEEEPIEEPPPSEPEPKAEDPAEVVSSTGDGRRRGKRRVTRKKQVMDDKGYLVTIQEQGWESFSEEETPPSSKSKSQPVKAEPATKPKKATGKGQGNIMSFFSKK
ncbi:DNA polymerase subunit Cdc27 [Hypoxylon fuscum]|nr:DNA polymerase subunit Cdc27 [Hypoxylon fuscum]